jgi:putative FmdB family regulatory protein
MPLYDYHCHRCGKTFEVRQKFSDPVLTEHESCGGELERLISAPALQFKGTGWYITDYAKNGKSPSSTATKSETKSESASETKNGSTSESKTESKPAPAPSAPSTTSDK